MKKRILPIVAALFVLAGCSADGGESNSANQETLVAPAGELTAHDHHDHNNDDATPEAGSSAGNSGTSEAKAPAEKPEYSLSGSVNDQVELLIETNLDMSEEYYGKLHQEGQGHVHLYINGRLIGPLKTKGPHSIAQLLQFGENEIKLALASNGHDESKYNTRYSFNYTYEAPTESSAP